MGIQCWSTLTKWKPIILVLMTSNYTFYIELKLLVIYLNHKCARKPRIIERISSDFKILYYIKVILCASVWYVNFIFGTAYQIEQPSWNNKRHARLGQLLPHSVHYESNRWLNFMSEKKTLLYKSNFIIYNNLWSKTYLIPPFLTVATLHWTASPEAVLMRRGLSP